MKFEHVYEKSAQFLIAIIIPGSECARFRHNSIVLASNTFVIITLFMARDSAGKSNRNCKIPRIDCQGVSQKYFSFYEFFKSKNILA